MVPPSRCAPTPLCDAAAGTPRAAVDRLNAEVNKILKDPEFRDKVAQQGLEVFASTPEQYDDIIKADYERYRRTVQAANLKMD